MVFCRLCLACFVCAGLSDLMLTASLSTHLYKNNLKMHLQHFLLFPFLLGLLFAPEIANACAVCFSSSEETLEAFYFTTIFLTLLPVVMLSTIGYWLYSKHRKT